MTARRTGAGRTTSGRASPRSPCRVATPTCWGRMTANRRRHMEATPLGCGSSSVASIPMGSSRPPSRCQKDKPATDLDDSLTTTLLDKATGGSAMTRIAHCCCGSLRAETTGEPAFVAACHCMECQRRTGSPFGVSTYFAKEQVRTKGPTKIYVRGSDSGREIEQHFCPNCGSTVLWYSEVVPDGIGIAFGAFAPFDALAEVLRVGDGAASLGDLR